MLKVDSSAPLFSLIVLTYNRPDPLRCCLQSIAEQDFEKSKFEVIVVDDGSKCAVRPVVDSFKEPLSITYVYQDHQGISAARNQGIRNSRGQFLVFIADDYTLPKSYLKTAHDFFDRYLDASVLTFNILSCGHGLGRIIQQLYTQLALWGRIADEELTGRIIKSNHLPASRAAVFKRDVFAKTGMFNEKIVGGEDTELTFRLSRNNIPVYFVSDFYILHWEKKSFWGFLDQRYRYGQHAFEVEGETKKEFNCLGTACFSFLAVCFYRFPLSLFSMCRKLFSTAKKTNQSKQLLFFFPFILVFCCFFLLGFYERAFRSGSHRSIESKVVQ